jgi:hypothetical protein
MEYIAAGLHEIGGNFLHAFSLIARRSWQKTLGRRPCALEVTGV